MKYLAGDRISIIWGTLCWLRNLFYIIYYYYYIWIGSVHFAWNGKTALLISIIAQLRMVKFVCIHSVFSLYTQTNLRNIHSNNLTISRSLSFIQVSRKQLTDTYFCFKGCLMLKKNLLAAVFHKYLKKSNGTAKWFYAK